MKPSLKMIILVLGILIVCGVLAAIIMTYVIDMSLAAQIQHHGVWAARIYRVDMTSDDLRKAITAAMSDANQAGDDALINQWHVWPSDHCEAVMEVVQGPRTIAYCEQATRKGFLHVLTDRSVEWRNRIPERCEKVRDEENRIDVLGSALEMGVNSTNEESEPDAVDGAEGEQTRD